MPFGADHQRVDVELEQALAVPDGEGLEREHRIDGAADIAFRPAAIAGEKRRHRQREERRGDLVARRRHHQDARIAEELGDNAARAEQEIGSDDGVAIEADDELGDGIRDHALDDERVAQSLQRRRRAAHRFRIAETEAETADLGLVGDGGADRLERDGKAEGDRCRFSLAGGAYQAAFGNAETVCR